MFKVTVNPSDSIFCNSNLIDITLKNKNHEIKFVKKYRSSFSGNISYLYRAIENNLDFFNRDFPMKIKNGKFYIIIGDGDNNYKFVCDNKEAKDFIKDLMEILVETP